MVPHPPVRPGSHDSQKEAADDAAAKAHSATISALQTQLSETQASLASHLDKIRSLEGMLAEHELIKAEVGMIKSQMEEAKREMDEIVNARKPLASGLAQLNGKSVANGAQDEDDFDDGASMASVDTVIPDAGDTNMGQVPKGMDEVESAAIDAAENDAHVGPRAPPDLPPEVAARDAAAAAAAAEAGASEAAKSSNSISASSEELLQAQNSALSARLEALEVQLEEALSLSRNLQSQHALATDAVRVLEERVQSLEKEVETKVAQVEGSVVRQLEERWVEWRQQIEEGWRKEREGWAEEREELRAVVRAWDEANRELEEKTAWASSAGQNSSAGGADSAVGTASVGGAATNGKSSRRVKAAQRRQSKRHLNPALRQLLYKPAQNELDDSSEDEDEEEEGAEASGRRRSADLAKGGANSSSSSSTSGAATKDAQTSSSSGDQGNPLSAGSNEIAHDNKEMDDTRSGSHDLAGQARQGAPQHEGRFAFSDNVSVVPSRSPYSLLLCLLLVNRTAIAFEMAFADHPLALLVSPLRLPLSRRHYPSSQPQAS